MALGGTSSGHDSERTPGPARIGVVIAAHEAAATIAAALASLQAQTLENWRAIIVDDASTDGTADIARRFLDDGRIELIVNDRNLGSGPSRNLAIRRLATDVVAVLDADDICLPTRLERQIDAFAADPTLDVLGAQIAEFGSWGGPETTISWPTRHEDIVAQLGRRMPIAHCAAAFRRDAVLGVGGYPSLPRSQDLGLLLRLRSTARFAALDTVEVLYRTRRPLPLRYAVASGRGGADARQLASGQPPLDARNRLRVDLRSTAGWLRRRLREAVPRREVFAYPDTPSGRDPSP